MYRVAKCSVVLFVVGLACLLPSRAHADYQSWLISNTSPDLYYEIGDASVAAAATDSSGHGHDGVYYATPTLGAAGPRPTDGFANMPSNNLCLQTAGGTYQQMYYNSAVTTAGISTSEYSMSGWFKATGSGLLNYQYMMTRGSSATNAPDELVGWNDNGSTLKPILYDSAGTNTIYYGSSFEFAMGTWYNVTMTRKSDNTVKVYVNGVEKLSQSYAFASGNNGEMVTAGGRLDNSFSLAGYSDEFAVWNRTLSSTEVLSIYNAGVNVPEPGTLALLTTGLIGLLAYAWRKRR